MLEGAAGCVVSGHVQAVLVCGGLGVLENQWMYPSHRDARFVLYSFARVCAGGATWHTIMHFSRCPWAETRH